MNENHFYYYKYVWILDQHQQTPMPRGPAGNLSDSRSRCKQQAGAEWREPMDARGHTPAPGSGPSRRVGLVLQTSCFQETRDMDCNGIFLGYFNLVWPNKVFLGPDTDSS